MFKKSFLYLLLSALAFSSIGLAQTCFVKGDKSLEISGIFASYYNYRILKPEEDNLKNNKFAIRDIRIGFNAQIANKLEADFRVDLLSLALSGTDPEVPSIVSAYVEYKALPVAIKFGYDKLPFSQGSLTSIYESAFWGGSQLIRGDFYSRRDLGITLSKAMWKQRVNIALGAYSGLGEAVFTANGGDSDPSGKLEYIGRVDVSYPSRFRYDEVDYKLSPTPLFRIGANARYADKTQPGSNVLPANVGGLYGIKVINGKRTVYGADIAFAYRGFSAQAEYLLINLQPSLDADPLYNYVTQDISNKQINAGGWQGQVNYFFKGIKSILSARYENYNINDLVYGNAERLSLAAAYQLNGFNNVLKFQYINILKEDTNSEPLKWTANYRIGWQYRF
jgi:hypothetical protein